MKNKIILAYHRVLPDDFANERGTLSVTTDNFENQIRYLLSNGYECVPVNEFMRNTNNSKKTFSITFDDGYRDNYFYAFPILKKYNLSATIFIISNYIDTTNSLWFGSTRQNYNTKEIDLSLSKNQIAEMLNHKIEFGSHTLSHPKLTKIDKLVARKEIVESKIKLEDLIGVKINQFCYPYGDCNNEIISEVENANYNYALITPPKHGIQNSNFTIKRTGVYLNDTMFKFKLKCTSMFYSFRERNIKELFNA